MLKRKKAMEKMEEYWLVKIRQLKKEYVEILENHCKNRRGLVKKNANVKKTHIKIKEGRTENGGVLASQDGKGKKKKYVKI